jgi:hypothetical protein
MAVKLSLKNTHRLGATIRKQASRQIFGPENESSEKFRRSMA